MIVSRRESPAAAGSFTAKIAACGCIEPPATLQPAFGSRGVLTRLATSAPGAESSADAAVSSSATVPDGENSLLGAGTAMVYPTLLATIGDVAHPSWRARSVGIYRLWRDGGFAIGALLAGALADAFDVRFAIWAVAALTAASGLAVLQRMYETHPRRTPKADACGQR